MLNYANNVWLRTVQDALMVLQHAQYVYKAIFITVQPNNANLSQKTAWKALLIHHVKNVKLAIQ